VDGKRQRLDKRVCLYVQKGVFVNTNIIKDVARQKQIWVTTAVAARVLTTGMENTALVEQHCDRHTKSKKENKSAREI